MGDVITMAKKTTKKAPKKRAKKAAKPATPRKAARQTRVPHTEDPRADKELDEMIADAYDLTLTFQGARREMRDARDRLMQELKRREIEIYETHDGKVVRLVHGKDKLNIKANPDHDAIEIEAD